MIQYDFKYSILTKIKFKQKKHLYILIVMINLKIIIELVLHLNNSTT